MPQPVTNVTGMLVDIMKYGTLSEHVLEHFISENPALLTSTHQGTAFLHHAIFHDPMQACKIIAYMRTLFAAGDKSMSLALAATDSFTGTPTVTYLHNAVAMNRTSVINTLLEDTDDIGINWREWNNLTVLDRAFESGDLELCKQLLDRGAEITYPQSNVHPDCLTLYSKAVCNKIDCNMMVTCMIQRRKQRFCMPNELWELIKTIFM
jgi:ankyrin repeat protein